MNMHALRSTEAVVEARLLLNVGEQILNAQNSAPCIGIVQDALLGAYKLTHKDTFLERSEIMDLAMHVKNPKGGDNDIPPPAILKPKQLWTGKQAMSMVIPYLTYHRSCRNSKKDVWDGDETEVVIRGGNLLCGKLCKQTLGASNQSLIHMLCKLVSPQAAIVFMSDCQRLINKWLMGQGFSIGIGDCLIPRDVQDKIEGNVKLAMNHVDNMYRSGKEAGVSAEQREADISKILSRMLDVVGGDIKQTLGFDNALKSMVAAGSKGNEMNISQIMACVGQQSVEGQRIFDKTQPEERTLPSFPLQCTSATSRGFVAESYINGLKPESMFFHTMGGREGIVDTSVKTADTGYLQRRIVKGLEMYVVEYDYTVRDSYKNILDFVYGGDNMDAAYLERVSLSFIFHTWDQLVKEVGESNPTEKAECQKLWELTQECKTAKTTLLVPELSAKAYLPFNVDVLIQQLQPCSSSATVLEPEEVQGKVEELCQEFEALGYNTLFLRTSLRYSLRSSRVCEELMSSMFEELLETVGRHFARAQIQPGEMVGVDAATSVGEPTTQLTLNTFHSAGCASKNVTLGVPRMKELADARRNISSPLTTIFLTAPFRQNLAFCTTLKETMVQIFLADVVVLSEVVYDPDPFRSCLGPVDQFLSRATAKFRNDAVLARFNNDYCPFVSRLVLDRDSLYRKELSVTDMWRILEEFFEESSSCLVEASEPDMDEWVVRIRLCGLQPMRKRLVDSLRKYRKYTEEQRTVMQKEYERSVTHLFLKHILKSVQICGVAGISGAVMDKLDDEYVIYAEGVNLGDLWDLPSVEWDRTISNNVLEVNDTLGIEAAAMVLYQELKTVLSFDGGYTSSRHLMMVVNGMTRGGYVMPLNRHGLNKLTTGPLVKSTFEEVVDVLFDAAMFGENNPMVSVSDNIMVGQPIPGGTGKVELLLDPAYVDRVRTKKRTQKPKKRLQILRTYFSRFAANLTNQGEPPGLGVPVWEPPMLSVASPRQPPPVFSAEVTEQAPVSACPGASSSGATLSQQLYLNRNTTMQDLNTGYAYVPSSPRLTTGSFRPSSPSLTRSLARPANNPHTISETLDSLVPTLLSYGLLGETRVTMYDRVSGALNLEEFRKFVTNFKFY